MLVVKIQQGLFIQVNQYIFRRGRTPVRPAHPVILRNPPRLFVGRVTKQPILSKLRDFLRDAQGRVPYIKLLSFHAFSFMKVFCRFFIITHVLIRTGNIIIGCDGGWMFYTQYLFFDS